MTKRSENNVSADRRSFFREIFVSAIEGVQHVSREVSDLRRALNDDSPNYSPSSDYDPSCYYDGMEDDTYGPPWPPTFGPPTPAKLRPYLRKLRDEAIENTMSEEESMK